MPTENKGWFKTSGTTLIELIFAVAIMLVVSAAFYQLFIYFHETYRFQEAVAELQQQARVAEGIVSKEIRHAGYDPAGLLFGSEDRPNPDRRTRSRSKVGCVRAAHDAEPILEATPGVFHFLADLNGSGQVDAPPDIDEDVRYEWVGAEGRTSCGDRRRPFTLYRDSGGGSQEVALNVETFKLEYFDKNGAALPNGILTQAERGEIKKIKITLVIRSDRGVGASVRSRPVRGLISEIRLKNR